MDTTLIVGIILSGGLLLGELASLIRLPKVTGYIVAGVILNPQLTHIIPADFASHTDFVTNFSLSFITFSIGGTILASHIRKLGKSIAWITFFEAQTTFLVVTLGIAFLIPILAPHTPGTFLATFLPIGLIIGALASPTDPTGTLAVVHQYRSRGDVTNTILSVSAFDDALGLINYSLAIVAAKVLVTHQGFNMDDSIIKPLISIGIALLLGGAFGFLFNFLCKLLWEETAGVFILMMFSLLTLCFGIARWLQCEELLATMMMGIIVTNFNIHRERVFEIMERYVEEIVFALFFTLSGMYLNFGVLTSSILLVGLYTFWRTGGKFLGAYIGSSIAGSPPRVKRYTAFGLIPSGGIIIGLALLLKQTPAFNPFSDIIISVIIGATVIHEFVGPILVRFALKRTGEITD